MPSREDDPEHQGYLIRRFGVERDGVCEAFEHEIPVACLRRLPTEAWTARLSYQFLIVVMDSLSLVRWTRLLVLLKTIGTLRPINFTNNGLGTNWQRVLQR